MEKVRRLIRPSKQGPDTSETFNSDTAELLGYTREYLNAVSGVQLSDNIIPLSHEIALCSAKLNTLCAKFDKLLAIQRISEVQRKRIEWAEMISAQRAQRAAKERVKIVKSLRGVDKKIFEKTGEIPTEYQDRIMGAFKLFLAASKDRE